MTRYGEKNMVKLSPSILTADFMSLGKSIKIMENENVPYVHIDVMDGIFVRNISIGMPVIKSIRKATELVLDVHIMIQEPERYIREFAESGSDIINIHYEACRNIPQALKMIKYYGKKAGITIKPGTNPENILKYIRELDMVLVMSVEPGFGNQKFMPEMLEKVKFLRHYIDENNIKCEIEIDGGIKHENAALAVRAGCDVIVAGSAVFNEDKDASESIREFYKIFAKEESR